MAHAEREIANRLLTLSAGRGEALSLMQVLNLACFAHGWRLALCGEPLPASAAHFRNRLQLLGQRFRPGTAFAAESYGI